MRGEAFECGAVLQIEWAPIEATDRDGGRELAVQEDRYADQGSHSGLADRRHRGRIGGIVVDHDRRARAQHGADDPHLRGSVYADDALAGPRTCGDVELLAAANVNGRVLGVGEE